MMMKIKREGEDMDYLVHNIAINLNHIRKAKGMSLDVVAEQTGVSKSMLAAIEKGAANPSIGVLGKRTKEYVFVLEGELSLELANQKVYTIEAGQSFRFSSLPAREARRAAACQRSPRPGPARRLRVR